MAERSFLFLLTSARRGGNSETLARHAAATLGSGVGQAWLDLSELVLPPFDDLRHDPRHGGIYPPPDPVGQRLLDATLAASDLVFVVPLYWYSLPASAKLYLDHWSGWMRLPGVEFRARMAGKTLWAISAISDDDASRAEPLLGTLRLTADYLGMRWGGSAIGFGNRPDDVLKDAAGLAAAERLFAAIA